MASLKFDVVLREDETLLNKGREYINEVPSRIPADIAAIRDWLAYQPHIKAVLDDEEILMFLRNRKFSLERTKERIDTYYTIRTMLPEFFGNRSSDEPIIHTLLKNGLFIPLTGHDLEGRLVVIIRVGAIDPKFVKFEDIFKSSTMLMELLMRKSQHLQVCGLTLIEDLQKFSLGHASLMNLAQMKKATYCWQEAFPIRPGSLNYLNTSPAFDNIFKIIKTFLKEKIKNRIKFYGDNLEALYDLVPREILPIEYGGTEKTCQELADSWLKVLDENKEWITVQNNYKVDEKLRVGMPKSSEELFGIVGSFRTLELD